jgi:hypothetical protein
MIKKTTYEPETTEEQVYIENYGKPNQEVIALKENILRLHGDLEVLNQELTTMALLVEAKNQEIFNLKVEIERLKNPPITEEVYFAQDFENCSISNGKLLGWDAELKNPTLIKGVYLNNLGGSAYITQDIRTDSGRKVMFAQAIDDDPSVSGVSRAQMTITFEPGVDLDVYHTRHRMWLNPDIAHLQNYSSAITWFTIFEAWNNVNPAMDGSTTGSARWTLALRKLSGVGSPLYWDLTAEYQQPESLKHRPFWSYQNKTVAIPFGKWFTMDIYMSRGEEFDGAMVIKVTVDGQATETIFNVSGTTVYPGIPSITLKEWQPFKLYTSDAVMDWMRSQQKTISAMYNDFKWLKA